MRKYRTFRKRFFVGIIDGVLLMSLSYALTEVFDMSTPTGLFVLNFVAPAVAIFYVIFCIGKFGQTIGKFAMGVKIYQLDERSVIGYKRGFFRESVPIIVSIVTMVTNNWFIDSVGNWIMLVWVILVGITMLTNPKRKGVNDYLASSIAIDVDEQQKELKTS